ncbi:hypothetical protein KCP73_00075 [Salmonella enterica subsp. enterica]|nr:hypothetical protein KCP73_00075 [Salmonella enterica subsp. enterica]
MPFDLPLKLANVPLVDSDKVAKICGMKYRDILCRRYAVLGRRAGGNFADWRWRAASLPSHLRYHWRRTTLCLLPHGSVFLGLVVGYATTTASTPRGGFQSDADRVRIKPRRQTCSTLGFCCRSLPRAAVNAALDVGAKFFCRST